MAFLFTTLILFRWKKVSTEEGMNWEELFNIISASVQTMISLQSNKIGEKHVGFKDPRTREFVDKYHSNLTDMMRRVILHDYKFL